MQKYKNNNIYFIESTNIKVFPCAYRGTDSGNIYDPEANVFTEYNFANIYGKQTKLISWSDNPDNLLKCVINGYYFEIKGIKPNNLYIEGQLYKFAIVPEQLTIVDDYKTEVLSPIGVDDISYLDTTIGDTNCFTGLAIVPSNGTDINGATYFSPCKLVDIKDSTTNTVTKTAVIDWQAYRLTDTLDTDSGDGSVRMLGTVKTNENNESVSTVCRAAGENAFAIGKNTKACGKFSIAGGAESKAKHENSVAIGDHVKTSASNQVVFGAYNKDNVNAALIIGGGSRSTTDDSESSSTTYDCESSSTTDDSGSSSTKKNILEISKTGDINATGKLDVAGNISSSNGGLQLTNGFISIDNGYEYQKILDTATYDSTISYYEKNAETNEMTESAVTDETFSDLKDSLYIKLHHLSSLDSNGNLLVDGNAQINKKLTVKEQAEVDGDITGHGSLTINGASKTHALTLGSLTGTSDYGSITVYGKELSGDPAQETKITAFSVNNEGAVTIAGNTTIAKTLTVDTNKLVVGANSVSINNSKVTVATDTTTISNTLTVSGATTITNNNVTTTINDNSFNYNNKFTVDTAGNITNANSLSLTNGGIDANGKITGKSLEVSGASIGTGGDVELAKGISIFKTADTNSNTKTYKAIKFSKDSIEIKDNDSAGNFNHKDALVITNEFTDNTATTSGQTPGLHVAGMLTAAGNFAIFESENKNKYITTKITQGGTAYFKQGLLVGGTVTGANESNDTVTFRVAPFSSDDTSNTSYATLKGDLNIKKYNDKAGNLKVEGRADISGDLTIGTAGGGIKFTSDTTGINITGIQSIKAKTFDATSDIRKKTAIQDYTCKNSILDLPIKEFEFIEDETHTKHIGCIAQDLQKLCPEIVHEDVDGYLSIEETKLVYLLLQEVKELKKEIKALKGE